MKLVRNGAISPAGWPTQNELRELTAKQYGYGIERLDTILFGARSLGSAAEAWRPPRISYMSQEEALRFHRAKEARRNEEIRARQTSIFHHPHLALPSRERREHLARMAAVCGFLPYYKDEKR